MSIFKKKFVRIIPRLDIKNGLVIKGINLEGLRVLGDPYEFANYYSKNLADEICYVDNVATLYGTNNLTNFIKKTSLNLRIPLVVGGGVRSIEQIKKILNSGADRICVNSAAVKNPNLITSAAKVFGSSTITVIIEYTKIGEKYFIAHSNGRELTNINPINWAKTVENAGAGEIILTSVRHEGLMKGFEKYITKKISNKSSIPVLVHGGCGSEQDIFEIVKSSNISGVILSSFLHYDIIGALKFKKKKIGNIDFLLKKINEKPKPKNNLKKIKMFLKKKGINVRL